MATHQTLASRSSTVSTARVCHELRTRSPMAKWTITFRVGSHFNCKLETPFPREQRPDNHKGSELIPWIIECWPCVAFNDTEVSKIYQKENTHGTIQQSSAEESVGHSTEGRRQPVWWSMETNNQNSQNKINREKTQSNRRVQHHKALVPHQFLSRALTAFGLDVQIVTPNCWFLQTDHETSRSSFFYSTQRGTPRVSVHEQTAVQSCENLR